MASIDFSLDSRIRKQYIPLINQQRYLRHVKRIAARNLTIPDVRLSFSKKPKINNEYDQLSVKCDSLSVDESETISEEQLVLTSIYNVAYYFTIHYPPSSNCNECRKPSRAQKSCTCNKLLYRSELSITNNPSWKAFEGASLCSPSISQFIIRVYYVQLNKKNLICDSNSAQNFVASDSDHSPLSHNSKNLFDSNNNNCTLNYNSNHSGEIGILFVEWNVHLTGLLYIGEDFPKEQRLANNTIIFGLAEGYYTSFCSVVSEELLNNILPPRESLQIQDPTMVRDSYCLNNLIRIQMVQYIIQGTVVRVQLARSSLEVAIKKAQVKKDKIAEIEKTQASIDFLASVISSRRKRLKKCEERLEEMENDIFEHNSVMSSNLQILKEKVNILFEYRSIKLVDAHIRLERICNALVNRRRMLAKELFQDIYVISPFPDSLGYSICDIFLPDSNHVDEHNSKMISIALGYVTHLVYILYLLLDIHFHYQLIPYGSRSSIVDNYNKVLKDNEKILPLYSKSGRNKIFFKHGLCLLNRSISFIRHSVGLKSSNLASTLANLYTLFTECLLVDNYSLNCDQTLFKFNPYSPTVESCYVTSKLKEGWNKNFLNDINAVKDKDFMMCFLWKELEKLTINMTKDDLIKNQNSIKNRSQSRFLSISSSNSVNTLPSTSSHSSNVSSPSSLLSEELKQIISNQRQYRRQVSNMRLSQITTSITSSYNSITSLTPSDPMCGPSTSSPEDIMRRRRLSTALCFDFADNYLSSSDISNSSTRNISISSNYLNTIKRIRSVSGYGINPQSSLSLTRGHFLNSYPARFESPPEQSDSPISLSLDKGLNHLSAENQMLNYSLNSSNSDAPGSCSSSNAEMLDVKYATSDSDKPCHSVMTIETAQQNNSNSFPT